MRSFDIDENGDRAASWRIEKTAEKRERGIRRARLSKWIRSAA